MGIKKNIIRIRNKLWLGSNKYSLNQYKESKQASKQRKKERRKERKKDRKNYRKKDRKKERKNERKKEPPSSRLFIAIKIA